jgi:hypothetical protein
MKWLSKTASAAALSLFLTGGAFAQDGASQAGISGPAKLAKGALDKLASPVVFTSTPNAIAEGVTTTTVQPDGSWETVYRGRIDSIVEIVGQGKLSAEQLRSLARAVNALPGKDTNLPGLVPGSAGDSLSYDGNTITGSSNSKLAIKDAEENGDRNAAEVWKTALPAFQKLQKLQAEPVKPAGRPGVDPTRKGSFSDLTFQVRTTVFPGDTTTYTVKPDGSYTSTIVGGADKLVRSGPSGTFTKAQLAAIERGLVSAEDPSAPTSWAGDDGARTFQVSWTDASGTHQITGQDDFKVPAQIKPLFDALDRATAAAPNPVAPKATSDKSTLDQAGTVLGDVGNTIANAATSLFHDVLGGSSAPRPAAKTDVEAPSRTDGLSGTLKTIVDDGAAGSRGDGPAEGP